MTNLVQKFEEKQIAELLGDREIPNFQAGDTLRVKVRIVEGKTDRLQAFEGLCIARKNKGINSSFTVRKISHGEGVERVFPLYSPRVEDIEVVRKGVVRRAKLYYMRELTGKAARIKEKRDFTTKEERKEAKKAEAAKKEAPKAEAKKDKDSK
ncbi:MAG: 50S ribosomal protein L19 [Alphaproteobacteria bacterium CG11_big_fil_rev_8_21_14_0_20_39_49]|nr:MAG: 50S ribosomal protein L19 [Alphaproteobacteria bacterium CG11_big_fil_rev_8_21_14_0_20_39_49]